MSRDGTELIEPAFALVPFTPGQGPFATSHLVELDRPAVRSGALEPWTEDHYTTTLVDKVRLSFAIVDTQDAGEVVAYRIASGLGKLEGFAHTHRTMVRPDLRRRGFGRTLLRSTARAAGARGYKGLTGKLHPSNDVSRRFLEATGWQFVAHVGSNELWRLDFVSGDTTGGTDN